jgi:hypothetical protein
MLFNPYKDQGLLQVVPGTRILHNQLGLQNAEFEDPKQRNRTWRVSTVYSPARRALGGIRVKVVDDKDFVSFINQRDFELLIGLAKPGDWCQWMDERYPGLNDHVEGWFGLTMDEFDLEDDLFERELIIRAQQPGQPLQPLELTRRIHLDHGSDHEQLDTLMWDADPETGLGPDPRLETLSSRWRMVERTRVEWERV